MVNRQPRSNSSAVFEVLERSLTQSGRSIGDLSTISPVLLVFVRHAGCTFCGETLCDIAHSRLAIEQSGTRIILVHMRDVAAVERLLVKYGLSGLDRICDPSQELYAAFDLKRGTFRQLFGPKVLWRAFVAGVLARYGAARPSADGAQLPGVFLIDNSEIVRSFRHRSAADRPDYVGLCVPGSLSAK